MYNEFHSSSLVQAFYIIILIISLAIYNSYASTYIPFKISNIDLDFEDGHSEYKVTKTDKGDNRMIIFDLMENNTDKIVFPMREQNCNNNAAFLHTLHGFDRPKEIIRKANYKYKSNNLLGFKSIRNSDKFTTADVPKNKIMPCYVRSACDIPGCDVDNACETVKQDDSQEIEGKSRTKKDRNFEKDDDGEIETKKDVKKAKHFEKDQEYYDEIETPVKDKIDKHYEKEMEKLEEQVEDGEHIEIRAKVAECFRRPTCQLCESVGPYEREAQEEYDECCYCCESW